MRVDDAFRDLTRCFLDTAPVIYYLELHPQYSPRVGQVFNRLDNGSLTAVTSPITLMECLIVPFRLGLVSAREEFAHFIASGPGIRFIDLDQENRPGRRFIACQIQSRFGGCLSSRRGTYFRM